MSCDLWMGLSINDSVYSCLFFFLTGLHFFHLLVGLFLCCLFFYNCSFSSSFSTLGKGQGIGPLARNCRWTLLTPWQQDYHWNLLRFNTSSQPTGWTLYPPLSTSFMSLSPSSTGNLIFGLLFLFFFCLAGLRSYNQQKTRNQ